MNVGVFQMYRVQYNIDLFYNKLTMCILDLYSLIATQNYLLPTQCTTSIYIQNTNSSHTFQRIYIEAEQMEMVKNGFNARRLTLVRTSVIQMSVFSYYHHSYLKMKEWMYLKWT